MPSADAPLDDAIDCMDLAVVEGAEGRGASLLESRLLAVDVDVRLPLLVRGACLRQDVFSCASAWRFFSIKRLRLSMSLARSTSYLIQNAAETMENHSPACRARKEEEGPPGAGRRVPRGERWEEEEEEGEEQAQ